MTVLRCAIYTRKSSEEGLEQGFNSLHAQREACEAYVLSQASEGWLAVATEFADGGFSGGNLQRPAMKRLLAEIDRGSIDVVVVYKVDRLTRSLSDFSKIVDQFDAKGVSFVSVTQSFNTTTSMGRLTLNMLLSFAQFEREVTSERIRDKIAASKAKGLWMGGRPPLGYDVVDQRLRINPGEAKTVAAIFQGYLRIGAVVPLTRELTAMKIGAKSWKTRDGRTVGGEPFTRGVIYHLLSNEVYRGAIRHGKKLYRGCHEPIIHDVTWDVVQHQLKTHAPGAPTSPKVGEDAFLKGLLVDDLGNPMQPSHTRKGSRRYNYYVASARVHGEAREVGSLPRIGAANIDAVVLDRIGPMLHPDWQANALLKVRAREALRRVSLGAKGIEIVLVSAACRPLTESGATHADELIKVAVSITLKHRSRSTLIVPSGTVVPISGIPNRSLVRAICIAREWRRQLEAGEVPTTKALAKREGLCPRHTTRLLPLAYLAPDLVETIIAGRQPASMTLQALTEKPLPRSWSQQRRLVTSYL